MKLWKAMKDLFAKTEVTEETFEYESIDSYLAKKKIVNVENDAEDDVVFQCDQIVEATDQMEQLTIEYDMVTSFFTDIQTIESLPEEVHAEIIDIANKIAVLEKETTTFLQTENRMTDEDFRMVQSIEKDLSQVFEKLKELEDMDLKIKRDLRQLEGEKNTQEYLQEVIVDKQAKLRIFLIVFGTLSIFTVIFLAFVATTTGNNLMLLILFILLLVAGMSALSIVTYKKMSYEFKMCEKKENRAISLMNRIKIKYINNTSTLDYFYEKYHIRSLRELENLYDQYLIMMDEVKNYQKSSGDLKELTDALTKLLFSNGVKDPDVWMKQSLALVDNREMVEVKHSLNVRRQKLREQISYNEDLRLSGLKAVQELLKEDPSLREQVRRELEIYHISVEEA